MDLTEEVYQGLVFTALELLAFVWLGTTLKRTPLHFASRYGTSEKAASVTSTKMEPPYHCQGNIFWDFSLLPGWSAHRGKNARMTAQNVRRNDTVHGAHTRVPLYRHFMAVASFWEVLVSVA